VLNEVTAWLATGRSRFRQLLESQNLPPPPKTSPKTSLTHQPAGDSRCAHAKEWTPTIDITEWRRARNKQLGRANLQYIRHGQFFALLATKGEHHFFQEEATQIRDIRRRPLRYAGYSISYRRRGRTRKGEPDPKWHAHVEIDRERYKELKAWLVEISTKRSTEFLTEVLSNLPYEPYAPVRRQKLNLLRSVNKSLDRSNEERI
jgi:hypothetical protein